MKDTCGDGSNHVFGVRGANDRGREPNERSGVLPVETFGAQSHLNKLFHRTYDSTSQPDSTRSQIGLAGSQAQDGAHRRVVSCWAGDMASVTVVVFAQGVFAEVRDSLIDGGNLYHAMVWVTDHELD